MNLNTIGVVYRKEFTEWIRDRRTLISTVIVPLLLFPLMMIGFSALAIKLVSAAKDETPKVMILGGEDSPDVLATLRKEAGLNIIPSADNWKDQISNKEIRAAAEIPSGFEKSMEGNSPETVKIYYYEGEIKSSFGADRLEKVFKGYREDVVKKSLAAKNLPASVLTPFKVEQENVAPPEKVGGATFGGFIGYLVILLCMTGAMYPAIDLTAGEKERGTIETILSSPIPRIDLVLGKFLLILSAAITTAALSVISMGVSFALLSHSSHSMGTTEKGNDVGAFMLQLSPKAVGSIFLMALPLAVLFAAVLMTIALFAKSYKEAQSYLTPMTFAVVIPAVASLMPGVELTPKLALIPILNTSLVCKEIMSGTYHWNSIGLIFASTCVYAVAALFIAIKMFQREEVLFRS
jgi:sodium transport system permease protein